MTTPKSRVYKKIAQLQLNDKCDGTNTIDELAYLIGVTPDYFIRNTKLGTTRLREDNRELLRVALRVSKAVMNDHFKKAVRVNKEDKGE